MPISIACISHQLLLLEGIEASVAGSEFDVSLVRFQGRLMLDELALDPPRLLLLDGGCPKFSALVLVDRLKRALPQTQLMVYLRSIRAVECQSLLSMGVMGLVDTSVSGVNLLQGLRKVVRRDVPTVFCMPFYVADDASFGSQRCNISRDYTHNSSTSRHQLQPCRKRRTPHLRLRLRSLYYFAKHPLLNVTINQSDANVQLSTNKTNSSR